MNVTPSLSPFFMYKVLLSPSSSHLVSQVNLHIFHNQSCITSPLYLASHHTLHLSMVPFQSLSSSIPRTLPFRRSLPPSSLFLLPTPHLTMVALFHSVDSATHQNIPSISSLSFVYQHLTLLVFHLFTISPHSSFDLLHLPK